MDTASEVRENKVNGRRIELRSVLLSIFYIFTDLLLRVETSLKCHFINLNCQSHANNVLNVCRVFHEQLCRHPILVDTMAVRAGIKHWEENTCITFEEKKKISGSAPMIEFIKGNG